MLKVNGLVKPSKDDMSEYLILSRYINSNYSGSEGSLGHKDSPIDASMKQSLEIPVTLEDFRRIWGSQLMHEIIANERNVFDLIVKAQEPQLQVETMKTKMGLFKIVWLANIIFWYKGDDGRLNRIYIGSTASKTQALLWERIRKVFDGDLLTHRKPSDAYLDM